MDASISGNKHHNTSQHYLQWLVLPIYASTG